MLKFLKNTKGASYSEMVVCIVVIAILAGTAMMETAPSVHESRVARAKGDLAALQMAVEKYRYDNPNINMDVYNGMVISSGTNLGQKLLTGKYVTKLPSPPWTGSTYIFNNGIVYTVDNQGKTISSN